VYFLKAAALMSTAVTNLGVDLISFSLILKHRVGSECGYPYIERPARRIPAAAGGGHAPGVIQVALTL
jgi:hypothetical protein